MTSTQESEALMLAKETGYIESLKEIPGDQCRSAGSDVEPVPCRMARLLGG
jgi:hypothetical protein